MDKLRNIKILIFIDGGSNCERLNGSFYIQNSDENNEFI